MEKTIRNELRMDLLDGCMPIGEIESCLNHWRNKYEIVRKSELTQLKAENERLKWEIFDIKLSFYVLSLLVVVITIWWLVEITNP
jgi:hypothetical protein